MEEPYIDFFIRKEKPKLSLFFTGTFHPEVVAMYALSFSWDDLEAYAFPPLCLIHMVLITVSWSMCRVILRAPFKPWFQDLLKHLLEVPIFYPGLTE